MSLLLVGLFYLVFGEIFNCFCFFGMLVIVYVNWVIKAGDVDFIISGGVEYMMCGLLVMLKLVCFFGGDVKVYDISFGWCFVNLKMEKMYGIDFMGNIVENLVDKFGISWEDQD